MRGILLGIMLPTLVSIAQASGGEHRVWIETKTDDGRLVALPHIEAAHEALLHYELISTKIGKAGRANSSQAGSVQLAQGETRSLTQLRLSVSDEDKYILLLRVHENGKLAGEHSVTYP